MMKALSEEEMLLVQLRKWLKKGHIHNASLNPAVINLAIPANEQRAAPVTVPNPTLINVAMPAGERVVAEIINLRSEALHFTNNGFTIPGRGFLRYSDVRSVAWKKGRLPFDQLELFLSDGSSVALEDLDQSVFPLRRFFEWMISKRDDTT